MRILTSRRGIVLLIVVSMWLVSLINVLIPMTGLTTPIFPQRPVSKYKLWTLILTTLTSSTYSLFLGIKYLKVSKHLLSIYRTCTRVRRKIASRKLFVYPFSMLLIITPLIYAYIFQQEPQSITQTICARKHSEYYPTGCVLSGNWWDLSWDKRVKITIDNNDVDSALSDFPVLVYLSNSSSGRYNDDVSFVFDEVGSNSKKIAVTTSDGTQCYVEIEKWDDASEQAWLWVKVPSISSTADTDLYLYYDSTQPDNTTYIGDIDSFPAQNVWDANFKVVHHFEGTSGSEPDSTSNDNDATVTGATRDATGKIGPCHDLDGTDDVLTIPNSASLDVGNQFTAEEWVKWEGSTPNRHRIWDRKTVYNGDNGWAIGLAADDTDYHILGSGGTYTDQPIVDSWTAGEWHYVVTIFNGTNARTYSDGSFKDDVTIDSVVDNDLDLLLGEYGGGGYNWNGKFDEFRLSDSIRSAAWIKASYESERDDLLDFGSEEPSYHVSGTVPGSVQTVDADYLIIRSAGSGTAASTYYPSGYTVGGSTNKTSGGLSNLTLNDGVYMTFRSYTYYDYDYHYAESDSISSTTSTTWQDKVTLTFTSVADAYLVMASAELRGSSTSYDMEAQLTIDGTTYAGLDTRPDETATDLYAHHFAMFKAINLTAASHTFKIQYRSSSYFGTCSIQHARIAVFRIFDYAYAENEGSQSVSGGYADKVTKTFNVEVAGEYLVIASAELNPASTFSSVLARMGIDSAYQDEVSLEGEQITSSWESYFTHDIEIFDTGSHTVSIQASSESGTHYIRRARIIAVRLTDYFFGWESGKSDSYTTNGATSWADKLVVAFTPSTQCEYLILATARVGGDASGGESYHSSFDFTLDGTEEGWWHGGISDDTDRITYATLKSSTLSEASHSLKLRYHSEFSTSPDAGMGSARIIAIPMCVLKAVEVEFTGSSNTYTWTQLEWTIDSAWTTGSLSVTLQLYDYSLGDYPSSGNGYMNYTSSATENTDETKSQNITVNPTHFRNATGYWKMKVKGVKAIETQFDFKADWIEFKPTYYNEYTASTEFLFSGMATPWSIEQINFTVVSQHNITNVNVTIQVWDYSSSAYATSGEGYLTYISMNTNETKLLSLNINPESYTSGGYAKIRVTSLKTTLTQYQQEINQIKLDWISYC